MTNKKFYISSSGLSSFFQCPAQFQYRKKWSKKKVGKDLQDGTDAHAVMEGKIPTKMSRRANRFAQGLQILRQGYRIVATEQKQYVPIEGGIVLVRIIDALALLDDDTPVLIDYKTATWPWKKIGDIAPKGHTFQVPAYLLPPEDPTPLTTWPTEIHFLITAEKGDGLIYIRHYDEADEHNFFSALHYVRRNQDVDVKNRGFGCNYCDFAKMCYGLPNHKELYNERKKK